MVKRLAVLVVVSGCGLGGGDDGDQPRVNVAKRAIQLEGNDVSCNSPAKTAFNSGLCVCEDANLVGQGLSVICEEHTPVDVGVNGKSNVVGEWEISGTLVSWGGVSNVGQLTVSQDLMTPKDVSGVGSVDVGRDLIVGGKLSTVGQLTIGGLLRAGGEVSSVGAGGNVARGEYQPRAAAPCGCDPSQLLDVQAAVDAARAKNDDAAIGLNPSQQSVGELTLELNGGRYFLESVKSVGALKIHVKKPSALYLAGDLSTVGTDTIDVDENASLDLYVAGSIENVGEWKVGTNTLAGVVRLFIGGAEGSSISSVGSKDFVGAIYAPRADVNLVGDTYIRGALFAKSLSGTGRLLIDYAKPAEPTAEACQ